jgi:hypothetical protein
MLRQKFFNLHGLVLWPFPHDLPGDYSLIWHPGATSFLSIFSIFPVGSGCGQQG